MDPGLWVIASYFGLALVALVAFKRKLIAAWDRDTRRLWFERPKPQGGRVWWVGVLLILVLAVLLPTFDL